MNKSADILAQLRALGDILLAMVLSGLIGYEREAKEATAGLRTLIMVGGAAALFTILGDTVTHHMLDGFGSNAVKADSIRIIQAVITGLAFMGASAILRPND